MQASLTTSFDPAIINRSGEIAPSRAPVLASAQTVSRCAIPVFIAILLGIGLRFAYLGSKPLWEDEGWTFVAATQGGSLFEATGLDPHPMSFYQIYRWMPDFVYRSDAAFRLPSALFSCVALLLFPVALRLGGVERRVRAWCVLAFALLPLSIRYAQEARAYALAQMLGMAVLTAYLWLMSDSRSRLRVLPARLAVLALVTAMSCLIDGYGLATPFVVGVHALVLAIMGKGDSRRRLRARWAVAAILLGTLLAVPYYVARIRYFALADDVHVIGEPSSFVKALAARLVQLSPLGVGFDQAPSGLAWLIYALAAGVAILLLASLRRPSEWMPKSTYRVLMLLMIVPFVVFGAMSLVSGSNLLQRTYLIIAAPGLATLFVIGCLSLTRRQAWATHVVCLLVPLTVSIGGLRSPGVRPDWRALFDRIRPEIQSGDGFVQELHENYDMYSFGPLRAYAWRDGLDTSAHRFLEYRVAADAPARRDSASPVRPADATATRRGAPAPGLLEFARSRPGGRVWAISTDWMAKGRTMDFVPVGRRLQTWKSRGVTAALWSVGL